MAKLTNLPNQTIIDGFKGKVDYYLNMGIPCARKWPHSPGRNRSPAVQAQWERFAWASREWNNLSPTVQDSYNAMAANTATTGRDLFVKSVISGLYRNPLP
jgi:hypothetical protein